MRLRNVKGSREMILSNEYVVKEPEEYKGMWKKVFKNSNPIHIEIGMGKGKFITELAKKNPEINYIGIEKYSSVLVRALEKRKELESDNLLFLRIEAEHVCDVFDMDEIDRIYLNFSDPWPKVRHEKRRLTSKEFLARYNKILKKDSHVEFKTDNRDLFDFSLEQVELASWKVKDVTFDLHNSKYVEDNVMTEYEEKFYEEGKPINRMVVFR